MKVKMRNDGSVFLIVVFIVALLSALVVGMLQVNTEEIQVMRNQIYAVEALTIAEAGLNHTFARIRGGYDPNLIDRPFAGGSYTVRVLGDLPNLTIVSQGTSAQGFVARIAANTTVGTSYPYIIRIDNLRINEE